MTANIQIPGLDPASTIDPANDFLLVRQGTSDRKATVGQVSETVFSRYAITGTPLTPTDVLLFGRNNGSGVYQNFTINPQQIGFLFGTACWFFQDTAPLGWTIIPGTGDRVLGTILAGGAINTYNTVGLQGNWQQQDVDGVPGQGLSIQQIPNHQHWGQFGQNQSNPNAQYIHGARNLPSGGDPRYGNTVILGIIGGAGDSAGHDSFGACLGHSHGSTWRPSACTGNICQKTV